MTIGLLEKKLQGGGGQNQPLTLALLPFEKQPARRRVNAKTSFKFHLKATSDNHNLRA